MEQVGESNALLLDVLEGLRGQDAIKFSETIMALCLFRAAAASPSTFVSH